MITNSPQPTDWSHTAQELLDGLPKVWTRGLLYFIIIFLAIAIPWAAFSQVDETGNARGKLEPKGNIFRLDTPVPGTVTKIAVKEGQNIKAGQVLLELDTELVRSEMKQVEDRLQGQSSQLSQLNLLKNQLFIALATQRQQIAAQDSEKQAQLEQTIQNIKALSNTYELQKEEKLAQVNQAKETLERSQTAAKLSQMTLTWAKNEVKRYEQLLQQGVVAEIVLVEKRDILQQKQGLHEQATSDVQQAKLRLQEQQTNYERTLKQATSDIEQAQLRLKAQEKNYQSSLKTSRLAILKSQEELNNRQREITAMQAEITQTKNQLNALQLQLGQRTIKSPTNGTIFTLPIARVGAVVQPSNIIAQIAPENTPLILKAQMPSQESGFLRLGLPVKLKFDAYPFQDYGIVEGKLTQISPDSKIIDTPEGKTEVFEVEVTLNQSYIQAQNKRIPLTAGQTATAEVIVRQRRLIDFILDPFRKLQNDGLDL
jgi:HlyD family secretion protein